MSFCSSARAKIKALLKKFDFYMENHVDAALSVTHKIKDILSSPVVDVLTAIIPTDLDSVIRAKLISGLGYAIEALTIEKDCASQTTLEGKLQCFITQLQKYSPDLQDAILMKMAQLLARILGDSNESQHIYDLFVQGKFSADK